MPEDEGPIHEDVGPLTLNDALLEFQKRAIKITKDATAKVQSKTGGTVYTYNYVKLETLLDEVLPVLNELGLLWIAMPCTLEDGVTPALAYELRFWHTDESLKGRMPLMLRQGTPQDLGAAISYGRRYALITVLNLATEDDEDGQISAPQKGAGEQLGVRKIPEAKAKKLVKEAVKVGVAGWPEPGGNLLQLAAAHAHAGDIGSCNTEAEAIKAMRQLNDDEAQQVWTWLERKAKEALKVEES